ncbi:MAG TPA: flagellar hook-basal body protein [Solirubrobacteraceae bacterium]|jgi:flagellar basal-body rod protein FlgG|nr:flagellar hook-basal body protein [Solirubrobacteraceae bacterium]
MLQGLYAAASGMEAQQNQLDAVSNDLANIDTVGYQGEIIGFQDLLYSSGGGSTGTNVATGAGSASGVVGRSAEQGSIQTTNRALDVAIQGHGYLEVRRPDGTIGLTRNGALQTNAKGQLTNGQGMLLEPPITIPPGTDASDVTIQPNGTVLANGKTLGQLKLVTVPAPNGLVADGDSIFSATAASGAIRPANGATLQQGSLEGSNVDMGKAMSQLMTAERGYQMSSNAVHYQDQMLQIANQIKA